MKQEINLDGVIYVLKEEKKLTFGELKVGDKFILASIGKIKNHMIKIHPIVQAGSYGMIINAVSITKADWGIGHSFHIYDNDEVKRVDQES